MRHYQCVCGNVLFFDNSTCLQCGSEVGYNPVDDRMEILDKESTFKRCGNGIAYGACNWVLSKESEASLCMSCSLNRTIPDVSSQRNLDAWHKTEIAKRRVLYTLIRLAIAPINKSVDPVKGLTFDFLRPAPGQQVLTGHEDGVITLNVEEAEDIEREKRRELFGESYRTLIGHFRHEIGHYFWDRFFQGDADNNPEMLAFREVFGDEREDYDAALARYYGQGPRPASAGTYITTYASAHPWEDWAETWAHYLHMVDGVETAESFGLDSKAVPIPITLFPTDAVQLPAPLEWQEGEGAALLNTLHSWARLAPAINEIAASLGHPTFYPFVLSEPIIKKLSLVHYLVKPSLPASRRGGSLIHGAKRTGVTLSRASHPRRRKGCGVRRRPPLRGAG